MNIKLAKNIGFCFGVKRALSLTLKALRENPGKTIYTLGPLIHNPPVIRDLRQKGVKVISSPAYAGRGIFVIPSHGLAPKVVEAARRRGAEILDATCPYVLRSQKIASGLADDGYHVVIVGEKLHPEIKGIIGRVGRAGTVVNRAVNLRSLPYRKKIGVIAQTTESLSRFRDIVAVLVGKTSELKVCNTLCVHTLDRQKEAVELAGKVCAMIVVGGRNSANTRRLYELCRKKVPAFHIESAGELGRGTRVLRVLRKVLNRGDRGCGPHQRSGVGVVSGTSTPDVSIRELVEKICDPHCRRHHCEGRA